MLWSRWFPFFIRSLVPPVSFSSTPNVVYYAYTYTNISGNIIKHIFTNFNERTNTLLYKNIYLSHFILDVSVVCERWVEQGQTAILIQLLLLTIAALLPHLGWDCSTGGHWGPQPSVCKLALTLGFLSLTNLIAAGTCLYSFITPTCFRFFLRLFTQVHLSDWRLGPGSI